jgi:uncharacterized protein (TIRG00374 family)
MGLNIPFGQLFQYFLVAIFFNNFLPTVIGGDVAKVYYLGRREGYFRIGGSVFLDRFFGFFAMTAFATLLSWHLNVSSTPFIVARNLLTVFLVVIIMVLFLTNVFAVERLFPKLASLNSRLESLGEKLQKTLVEIKMVSLKFWVLLGVMGITLTYFVLMTLIYSRFFDLSSNHTPSYWGIMAVLFGIGVLANIPLTVNGIGLREQLHYLLFAALGLSKEISVTISFLIFSNILFVSLIGCFFWVKLRNEKSRLEEKGL